MSSVLVVDDEQPIRDVLTRWLSAAGHAALAADGADAALQVLTTNAVDVILCDIDMPVHDGYWLVARVRERSPDIAIVLATANPEVPPSVSLQTGVTAYVLKPFDRSRLLWTVREAADWHQNHVGGTAPPRRGRSIDEWLDE